VKVEHSMDMFVCVFLNIFIGMLHYIMFVILHAYMFVLCCSSAPKKLCFV